MMQAAELHTAVLHGLSLTVVVLNDQGFGQERHSLAHKGMPIDEAMTPSPDFARFAEPVEPRGERLPQGRRDRLSAALHVALEQESRHLLE